MCGSGPRRRGAELVARRAARPLRPVHPRRGCRRAAPGLAPATCEARARSACSCCTGAASDPADVGVPVAARRARAAVREGGDRDRLAASLRGARHRDDDVSQVLLAGSFGSYLSPSSAIRIGLVPKLAMTRIVWAGNVAGEGAKMIALSQARARRRGRDLEEVEYVELSGRADFNDASSTALLPGMSTAGVLACGALALHVKAIAARNGLELDVHPLPPRAAQPAGAHRARPRGAGEQLHGRYDRIVVGYADCGTRGAIDELVRAARGRAPAGETCYDLFAGTAPSPRSARRSRDLLPHRLPGEDVRPAGVAASGSTGTPTYVTPTSATTAGWCGWRRSRRPASRLRPRPPP